MQKQVMRSVLLFLILLSVGLLIGCAGSSVYVPVGETTQASDYSDTDMRVMANSMYNSITSRLSQVKRDQESPPIVAFLYLKNKTSEHIDTEMIADKLQIELIKAGSLRLVDRKRIKDMTQEFDLGGSGLIDPASAKNAGHVLGADLFLYGELGSIKKTQGKTHLNFYRLSMKILDAETNEILWADDFEVKKKSKDGFISW